MTPTLRPETPEELQRAAQWVHDLDAYRDQRQTEREGQQGQQGGQA